MLRSRDPSCTAGRPGSGSVSTEVVPATAKADCKPTRKKRWSSSKSHGHGPASLSRHNKNGFCSHRQICPAVVRGMSPERCVRSVEVHRIEPKGSLFLDHHIPTLICNHFQHRCSPPPFPEMRLPNSRSANCLFHFLVCCLHAPFYCIFSFHTATRSPGLSPLLASSAALRRRAASTVSPATPLARPRYPAASPRTF